MANDATGDPQNTQQDFSPDEVKAMERGWKPQDQWEGDPNQWKDAKTFNELGELMDRVSHQTREIKDLRETLNEFKEHNRKIEKIALEKAKKELLKQKAEALEVGDYGRVVEIDEDVKKADRDLAAANQPAETKKRDPFNEYYQNEWIGKNAWYTSNLTMQGAAEKYAEVYAKEHPDCTPSEIFTHITTEIKKEFPAYFKNPNREDPPAVGSGSNGKGRKSRQSRLNLTAEEERVGQRFVDRGLYESLDDYAAALNK